MFEGEESRGVCPELPGNSGCGRGMISRRRRARRGKWKRYLLLLESSGYGDIVLTQYGSAATQATGTASEELDEVVSATLRLEVIEGWQEKDEVTEVRRILEGGEAFERLFVGSKELLHRLPGRKSQLTARQVLSLEEMGVLQRKTRAGPPVKHVCKAFTVPKPSGKRRLIVDASWLGELMKEPYHTELPSLDEVRLAVRTYNFVAQLDGKSWFYQFGARGIRQYFAVRTCLGVFCLVVLAMGWAWSVYIAQTVSSTVLGKAVKNLRGVNGMVYIDNHLLFGMTEDELVRAVASLERTGAECGLVFKEGDHRPSTTSDVLGMAVDMRGKTVSLSSAFVDKFGCFWKVYSLRPGEQTIRTTWRLFGGIFWAMRVLALRQCDFVGMKQFVSRRARDICEGSRDWEHRVVWWKAAWEDVKRVVAVILRNEPVSVVPPASSWIEAVWADASGSGGGYVLPEYGLVDSWKWNPEQEKQPIHVKEAWALLRAVLKWKRVRQGASGAVLKTDSMLVHAALRSFKATGFAFTKAIKEIADEMDGIDWRVEWVPSGENVADAPSRQK